MDRIEKGKSAVYGLPCETREKGTFSMIGSILVAVSLCFAMALLAGCGTAPGPTQDEQNAQEEPVSSLTEESTAEEGGTSAAEPLSIEVADRHLVLEKFTTYPDVVSRDPEMTGGYSMSFLMSEPDAPVVGTRIGAVSGFDIWPEFDTSISSLPAAVRFEQLDGADGYKSRATFYFEGTLESNDLSMLDEIRYKAAGEDDDDSLWIDSQSAEQIAFVEGGDDWPDAVTLRDDLSEGLQDVPFDEDLVLASNVTVLYHVLDWWAYDLLHDCCQKLVDDGAMEQMAADAPNGYFNFDSSPELVFSDEDVEEQLTGGLSIELDHVVFCEGTDVYGDYCDVYFNSIAGNEELAQYPSYYPASTIVDFYGESDSWGVSSDQADMFADSIDGCRYLVACLGVESRRDVDYYDSPKTDRLVVSTIVVVADAQTREFVHIHEVGVDAPGMVTDSPAGSMMKDEAREYMVSLL